ncbi:uncharacterized protein LOC126897280 [Daktulosphaira vitifoliae]|uniref:uncharacterized protein LOC126897280 n=1 Tax=Daktulosphaira vitifoliae TaxID=58002 RepID=UPI0021AA19DB|nr:uncharacterized protein LOC126897280 [Daktulosphaira vitifoliae]
MSKQKQDPSIEETEEEFITRLTQPRIWSTLNTSYFIQSMPEERLEEVLDLFKSYYVYEEALCANSGLVNDKESFDQFLELIKTWILDTLTTVAIEKNSGKIVGVLVCRVCSEEDHSLDFSRLRLYKGKIWNEIQYFKNNLSQNVDIYKIYKTSVFCQVYAWYVLQSHRDQGIGKKLLETVVAHQMPEMKYFGCNAIFGIFTSNKSQCIAESLGFKTLEEAKYGERAIENNVQYLNNRKIAENVNIKAMAMVIN